MGLTLATVHLIAPLLEAFERRASQRVLTLGVQDCHFTYDELIAFLQRHGLPFRAATSVRQTTGFKWAAAADRQRYSRNVHQLTFFEVFGFDPANVHALDVDEFEGATLIHDLNLPIMSAAEFDVVLDSGTIEHVFSLKDSLFNVARLTKRGGRTILLSPADMLNHGFINVNAELFRDFFTSNGFRELALKYILFPRNARTRHYLQFDPAALTTSVPAYNALVYGVYQKESDEQLRVPQQGYYGGLWNHENGSGDDGSSPRVQTLLKRWIDSSFLLSVVARSFHMRRRGTKVAI